VPCGVFALAKRLKLSHLPNALFALEAASHFVQKIGYKSEK
jgi:hypothetical protein